MTKSFSDNIIYIDQISGVANCLLFPLRNTLFRFKFSLPRGLKVIEK